MTPAQCRAARGALGWSQHDLAAKADVARGTIVDFEREKRLPMRRTLRDLVDCFTTAGVAFSYGQPIEAVQWGLK